MVKKRQIPRHPHTRERTAESAEGLRAGITGKQPARPVGARLLLAFCVTYYFFCCCGSLVVVAREEIKGKEGARLGKIIFNSTSSLSQKPRENVRRRWQEQHIQPGCTVVVLYSMQQPRERRPHRLLHGRRRGAAQDRV